MMAELGYWPAAPSDGCGGITVPSAELEVGIEAREYAQWFAAQEDIGAFPAGCTDYTSNRAAVLAFEAFRLMNAGLFWGSDENGPKLVPTLLRMAADEYERAMREEIPY
jgi:hypothetical protein